MKQRLQITSACVLAAFLTSCSTTGTGGTTGPGTGTGTTTASNAGTDEYNGTQDELKTMQEARFSYTVDGVWKGAATGAATGALTAAVTGGNVRDSAIKGGIGGGMAGGLMGFRTGDEKGKEKVDQKRTQKEKETAIKQQIATAQKFNNAASSAILKLRAQLKSATDPKQKAKIRALAAKHAKVCREKIADNKILLNDEEAKSLPGYDKHKKQISEMINADKVFTAIAENESDQKLS
jgi:hypothetical protein